MSLDNAQQENLLVLLTFDDLRAKIIRGVIDPSMYGGMYRDIAVRIYDYIDRYKKAPAEHIADLLNDKISAANKNKRERELYKDIVISIDSMRDKINADFVMSRVEAFVERQSLRMVAIDLAKALQKDTDESLDEAKTLISKAGREQMKVFNPGTRLSDKAKALAFIDNRVEAFMTGIPELDKRNYGPTRTEAHLYISDTKKGKTWWLVWLGKIAAMNRLRTAHITLEMGEDKVAMRYMQAFFAVAKRPDPIQRVKFKRDQLGNLKELEDVRIKPFINMQDEKLRDKLEKQIDKFSRRMLDNIFIKRFPTGALTINQLEAYLDNLDSSERFQPDLLIVDYPDIMKFDRANYRHGIDELYQGLRGLGVSRNCAVALVSQSNRAGGSAKQLGRSNVAEAYSKIQHADVALTYSQTEAEKNLGLARLTVEAGRNDEDHITVLLSQNYAMGQFAIDSILMSKGYWTMIDKSAKEEADDDDDDDDDVSGV